MGDIFDSMVVGFLAVLGINTARDGFQEATTYTPHLSALIKIMQMLILQRAVAAVEDGETEYPAQMIDDMQDRFMAYGSRSPINWAQKLRVYRKKIRDSTTSLGYMVWSEDRQKLTYRDLELSMSGLKQFARWQVEAAQEQLQQLLLIHTDEAREDVVPMLRLQDLKDNLALNQDSSRLSKVLQQEFKAYLNTTANITLWRHAAIAISQKHLGGLKFKRHYGLEPAPTWAAEQTGHTANVAGNVYARGIEEAPGHVELARTDYRALSRT
ncbi:hypothetical protein V501_03876 [Pseudogymnoascus sp. VKM F-4519 (FW-2642)]|nr:hypothetical protein V501_03876 [Pseudogymnoascus sp. VKM F-4519 (FW-2642)]